MHAEKVIHLDGVLTYLLSEEVNSSIIESFIRDLTHGNIFLLSILPSEHKGTHSNRQRFYRCQDHEKKQILLELQYVREEHYLQELLQRTARTIVQERVKEIKRNGIERVISVQLLYRSQILECSLERNYIFHHLSTVPVPQRKKNHRLQGSRENEKQVKSEQSENANIAVEQIIVCLDQFSDEIHAPFDEWALILKYGKLRENFKSSGINKLYQQFTLAP